MLEERAKFYVLYVKGASFCSWNVRSPHRCLIDGYSSLASMRDAKVKKLEKGASGYWTVKNGRQGCQ